MAIGCKISCSPVFLGVLVFCLTFSGVLSTKTQISGPDTFLFFCGVLKDFELAKYEPVALIPEIRHLILEYE